MGLAFLIVQWGMLARLTFWELSWDVIEPITYFLGSGSTILFYCYFMAPPWPCIAHTPASFGQVPNIIDINLHLYVFDEVLSLVALLC